MCPFRLAKEEEDRGTGAALRQRCDNHGLDRMETILRLVEDLREWSLEDLVGDLHRTYILGDFRVVVVEGGQAMQENDLAGLEHPGVAHHLHVDLEGTQQRKALLKKTLLPH